MKRVLLILILVFPLVAFAHKEQGKRYKKGTVKELKGVISGAVCGIQGMVCNHEPGKYGYELLGFFDDKRGFFYLANVPQDILNKINRQEVEIVGKVYRERATIIAEKIIKDGNVVWQTEIKGESK